MFSGYVECVVEIFKDHWTHQPISKQQHSSQDAQPVRFLQSRNHSSNNDDNNNIIMCVIVIFHCCISPFHSYFNRAEMIWYKIWFSKRYGIKTMNFCHVVILFTDKNNYRYRLHVHIFEIFRLYSYIHFCFRILDQDETKVLLKSK